MPLHEFRCTECRTDSEILVRNSETPVCPSCGSKALDKLLSAAAPRTGGSLPIASSCPPPSAPPCGPGCCRLP
jgi:putative FmdB family regulatory protein